MQLPITGNVLLKCGLLHLKFLLKTARSKKCFPLTKLKKKWRRKHFLRLNFTKFSTQEPSIPHFSNTMLAEVLFCEKFYSIIFKKVNKILKSTYNSTCRILFFKIHF